MIKKIMLVLAVTAMIVIITVGAIVLKDKSFSPECYTSGEGIALSDNIGERE